MGILKRGFYNLLKFYEIEILKIINPNNFSKIQSPRIPQMSPNEIYWILNPFIRDYFYILKWLWQSPEKVLIKIHEIKT